MVRIIGSALLLVVALQVHSAHAEEGQDSISKDTRLLLSVKNEKGSVWQSEALQLKCKANSRSKGILVIKFAPFTVASRENPPQLSAKLSLASVPEEVEGFTELSTSIGDQNYRDVRLAEKNGVKTITFTRAIESVDKPTDKTPKILEQHFSITFEYELRDDELVLKGFPTDETTWGIVQFTTQAKQVSFRPAK